MRLKVFCDIHVGSPIANMTPSELLNIKPDIDTILAGDICDFANAKEEYLVELKYLYQKLVAAHGENYIPGNHERMGISNETVIRVSQSGTRVCIVHGDIEANPRKWKEYRQKPHGAGWFKRKFIIPLIREAEEILERKPSREILRRIWIKARSHNCSVYVCGHYHPEKTIVLTYEGIKIYLLPRGLSYVDIN